MKISIIMPTYNDATHIASSIQSVVSQTYTNWELLIMDDGSNDNTEEVVNQFLDHRIHYYYQENKGQLVALNQLCQYISGDIVMMLHSDDALFDNQCFEENIKHFYDASVDGIFGDFHQFFDSGKPDEIVFAPTTLGVTAVKKLITLLGSNIIFDHFFVRRNKFEENVKFNYLTYYMPYWLNFTGKTVTSLHLKFTSKPWYHYRVYDQNYTNSVIGNFEVYFTRFRTIFFLSDYFTVPFPLFQKELLRRYKVLGPAFSSKASNKHMAKCYKANIRSMRNRTPKAFTHYFDKLVLFYQSGSNRVITLNSPIEISYQPSEARRFYQDLRNNTLPTIVDEIISNFSKGFSRINVNNSSEKQQLEELLKFLCVRAEVIISI